MWLRWIVWVLGAIVGGYVAIVLLFALYFSLASYIPLLARKLRAPSSDPGRLQVTSPGSSEARTAPAGRGARAEAAGKPDEA